MGNCWMTAAIMAAWLIRFMHVVTDQVHQKLHHIMICHPCAREPRPHCGPSLPFE